MKACISLKMSAEIHTEEARILAKSVFKNWGEQADMHICWITLNIPTATDEKYTKGKSSLNHKT